MSERTFVIIKPDAVRRGLVGAILSRYETKGLRIAALEQRIVDAETADRHYAEHLAQPWYPSLREFITAGPLVALILEGPSAIDAVRTLNGVTDGRVAAPGSIRGDFSLSNQANVVHASDSPGSAVREISLWFPDLA